MTTMPIIGRALDASTVSPSPKVDEARLPAVVAAHGVRA